MKLRNTILATVLGLGSLTAAGAVASAQRTPEGSPRRPSAGTAVKVPQYVPLKCENSGGSQDAGKQPWITNTLGKTLPRNHRIYWNSSDGDGGVLVLQNAVAPGAGFKALGEPGQGYTCKAYTPKF